MKIVEKQIEQPQQYTEQEAEMAVLGSMLISSKAADIVLSTAWEDDFSNPHHRFLFHEFARIYYEQGTLDELFVANDICKNNKLKDPNRLRDYLGQLQIKTPSAANVEEYCTILREAANKRKAKEAAERVLSGLRDNSKSGAELAAQLRDEMEALQAKPMAEANGAQAVDKEIEAEIQGTRYAVKIPNFPCLSTTKALLPGSLTVLCGSPGASKSLLLLEWIWRWDMAGVPVSVLEMEKGAAFHMRRALAQIAACSTLTDDVWVKRNAEQARATKEHYRKQLERFSEESVIQSPACRVDVDNIIRWIWSECRNGRRVIAIDPINAMAGQDRRFLDQERLVGEAGNLVTKYGASLIMVIHPATPKPGDKLVAAQENIQGSKSLRQFVDTILWLEAHGPESQSFPHLDEYGQPEPASLGRMRPEQPYNRTLHLLKVRLAPGAGKRIGCWMNSENLWHTERGWIL
jgi:replicative DNA helicase